jgi:uncharacterized protein YdeI (YjbR/CyaY-like superfamily)
MTMGTRDPRVDAYIAKQQPFAVPILKQIRDTIHDASPEIHETIKWGAPAWEYKGLLCQMAAFKEHCALGFWKGTLIVAKNNKSLDAAGSFGRIKSVKDLPPKKELVGYVKKAMALNDAGAKAPKKPKEVKKRIPMPSDMKEALQRNGRAKSTFDEFSPSHKREYLEWITEAKQPETRQRRLSQAVEWIAEGKPRMWKYVK